MADDDKGLYFSEVYGGARDGEKVPARRAMIFWHEGAWLLYVFVGGIEMEYVCPVDLPAPQEPANG